MVANGGGTLVNLLCAYADAHLYFQYNIAYTANSIKFNDNDGENTIHSGPAGQSWGTGRDVRYEAIGTPGSTDFFRHHMAGFPLDQYEASEADYGNLQLLSVADTGQGKYTPANSARNQAIIGAISAAMDTNGDPDNRATPAGNIAYWFQTAATYVDTNWSNTTAWENGPSSVPGTTPAADRAISGTARRRYTETPDPGFYSDLCIGLIALVMAAKRSRRATQF